MAEQETRVCSEGSLAYAGSAPLWASRLQCWSPHANLELASKVNSENGSDLALAEDQQQTGPSNLLIWLEGFHELPLHLVQVADLKLQVSEPWLRSILSIYDAAIWEMACITNASVGFIAGVLTSAQCANRSYPSNPFDLFAGVCKQRIYPSIPPDRSALAPKTGLHSDWVHAPRSALASARCLVFLDMDRATAARKSATFMSQSEILDLPGEAPVFQIQVTFSRKTILLWVRPTDPVQNLLLQLECRLGIPSFHLRLIYQGKQLQNSSPLFFYSIQKDAVITATFRLRGGSIGQTSSAPSFSYKDAVRKDAAHPQVSSKANQPSLSPKPFLVDKIEDVPTISFNHFGIEEQYQVFAESAIICRFNGLWPRTADLYQWVHTNWTKRSRICLCAKGFFIVVFDLAEDYQRALTGGPWFWGSAGLFLTPWFPDFDPSTAVITKLPIWVRLPNLPAHLWHTSVFIAIGDTLGRFLAVDSSRKEHGLYTYARMCAEVDLSKGLPEQINLKIGDFHWTQSLDYENTAFRCRHCHQTGHLQSTCTQLLGKKKNLTRKPKSKSWSTCVPPTNDTDYSSSDEEELEAELEADGQNNETLSEAPSGCPEVPSAPPISQKRSHDSTSSDSDKDIPPPEQNSLQLVTTHPNSTGWIKVGKKKGKKCRVAVTTHSG